MTMLQICWCWIRNHKPCTLLFFVCGKWPSVCTFSMCPMMCVRSKAVQMFTSEVCSCHRWCAASYKYIRSPLFSPTQPLQSVNASPLTSQGCCLCTVLLCHWRLVPLGLCTLIPLSLLGAGPVFSQGSFLCEPAQPLSLSGCHSPALHNTHTHTHTHTHTQTKYHDPQVWNLQNKRASSLFWVVLQDVQVSEDIKEMEKNATTK